MFSVLYISRDSEMKRLQNTVRSLIKEKAFKASVVQAKHRRHRADPSLASSTKHVLSTVKQVSTDVGFTFSYHLTHCH